MNFQQGTLTELAVTAVSVRVANPVETDSRVMVMFEQDDTGEKDGNSNDNDALKRRRKVIAHIGKVKRVDKRSGQYDVIVQFINLTADQIEVLIRLTSNAARKANKSLSNRKEKLVKELEVAGAGA